MSAFIGSGKVKIAPYGSGLTFSLRVFRDVGNTSAFQFSFSENKQELRDYRDPSGGVDASVSRIESVTGQCDLRHFTSENIALSTWGTAEALSVVAIIGEAHVANAGNFVPTEQLIDTTIAVVVKKGATTLDTDDYTVSSGGITFADTLTTVGLVDGDAITIDYTPLAGDDIQSLITSAPNVSIFFEGINNVTGKPATLRIYKAKLGVAANIGLIGDDFGTLQLSFTVEKDETVAGVGTSKYFALQQAA